MEYQNVIDRAPEVEVNCELSLKDRLVRYLKSKYDVNGDYAWINGGEIERLTLQAGYKSSNGSRRLRELYVENVLERRENSKGHVEYRHAAKR